MDIHTKQRFGKLTVLDCDYSTDDYQRRLALVECDCGTKKPVLVANLKQGRTQSCGLCTHWGGARKRAYKPRKTAAPSKKVSLVRTVNAIGIGKAGTRASE